MEPHATHQNGVDIDIRPERKDGQNTEVDIFMAQYDRGLTAELINLWWEKAPVGHGDPTENYNRSIDAWVQAGGEQSRQPMAGELRSATGSEVTEYANGAQNAGIQGLHFYTDEPGTAAGVWDAVRQS